MVLLPYLLKRSPWWRSHRLRVFTLVDVEDSEFPPFPPFQSH